MQIKHRIYLSFMVLALLPLLLLSFLDERAAEQVLSETIAHDFTQLAEEKAGAIGRIFDSRINETILLAHRPEVIAAVNAANRRTAALSKSEIERIDQEWIERGGDTLTAERILNNSLSRLLMEIQARRPTVYGEMFVTDSYGATVAMTRTLSDYYQADEYWWQAAYKLNDGAFLDDRGYDISAETVVVGVTVPIISNGEKIGVFKINYRVQDILDIVKASRETSGYEITLARSDGSIIVSSSHSHPGMLSPEELSAIKDHDSEVWHGTSGGQAVILVHYPMKHPFSTRITTEAVTGVTGETTQLKRWHVLFSVEEEALFTPLKTLRNTVIVIALMAIVLASLAGFWLSRSFTRPLYQLKHGAQVIATGDLTHRLDIDTKDELGELANTFNGMTQQLRKTLASRDELNRQVKERIRSEKALQQSEERYRHLLHNLPQRIFYKDMEGRYVTVNPSYANIFGVDPEDFIGKTDYDFHPQQYAEKYRADDRAVIDSGRVQEFDEALEHEGELHYVHTVKAPVFDEQGKARGMLGIFWDETEKHRAQEEIKVAREYLRNVINSMPVILVGLDCRGIITHWNAVAAQRTGLSEAEAVAKPLATVGLLPEHLLNQVLESLCSDEGMRLTNQGVSHNGVEQRINIVTYPIAAHEAGGSVLMMEDVTERVRVETMMVQTEKMMSVGGLAAGMAHELNNPLGGILQGLQNVKRRLSPELEKNANVAANHHIDLNELQEYLDERRITSLLEGMADAGRRATNIIANMMNFSRTLAETVTPVDIAALLDSVVELAELDYDLKKKYGFRDVTIVKDYAEDLPYVPCLEKEIKQVILNLLRNAAQALSMQSERKASPTITLRTRLDEGMARIEVEDNGPGMEASVRKRALEPFFTTREVGEGTGLGLSVAYYLIHEQHHGSIEIDSEPNKGTCIRILLPMNQGAKS